MGWCNNFMFKYENSESCEPVEMCFLDWQVSNLLSPVVDLSCFFCSAATKEKLKQLDKHLHIYHESLSSFLEEMDCDPQKLFPMHVLEDHWREYSKYGLIFSFVLLRSLCIDADEAPNTTSESFTDSMEKPIKEENIYRERLVDVVMHFMERKVTLCKSS